MRSILISMLLLISLETMCQETANLPKDTPLFQIWDKDNKKGFIDVGGNIIVHPQFDKVEEFSEGLAAVRIEKKWGFINQKGEMVLLPQWLDTTQWDHCGPISLPVSYSFSEGLATVFEKDASGNFRCGYINQKGEYVIKPNLGLKCGKFRNGLAAVLMDLGDSSTVNPTGLWGFIDKQGNWAISPQFSEVNDFFDVFALVQTKYVEQGEANYSNSLSLIDKNGAIAKGKKDCRWRYEFSEGLAWVSVGDWGTKDFENYFLNEKCEKVLTFPPDIIISSNFSEGLAPICRQFYDKNKNLKIECGYIDRTGKQVIPLKFERATAFSEGLAIVTAENSAPYYINHKGEMFFEPRSITDKNQTSWSWKSPAPFKNGLAFQVLYDSPNVFGYMNKQGKYVWVSPNADKYLGKNWLKEFYIGSQKFD